MAAAEQDTVGERLERLVAGDTAAAAWLYDTFSLRLFRRLRQRYGYPGGLDPEDLLQDAFLFYFRNDCKVLRDFLARVPAERRTAARLERRLWDLACGLATNQRLSAAHRRVRTLGEHDEPPPAPSDEGPILDRDLLQRLDACLRGQGERLYLYYKLRCRDGYKPREIVRLTGWSKKITYKLKQALSEAVEHCAAGLGLDR